jgi:hypothetical protein
MADLAEAIDLPNRIQRELTRRRREALRGPRRAKRKKAADEDEVIEFFALENLLSRPCVDHHLVLRSMKPERAFDRRRLASQSITYLSV